MECGAWRVGVGVAGDVGVEVEFQAHPAETQEVGLPSKDASEGAKVLFVAPTGGQTCTRASARLVDERVQAHTHTWPPYPPT